MKIALYHGYELSGSGSNEYNRYLAQRFLELGHTVHIICREKHPERIPYINEVWHWSENGTVDQRSRTSANGSHCVLHQIPTGPIYPVYLTDKQRPGDVRRFTELSDAQLQEFIHINQTILTKIFSAVPVDIVYANHLVMQPALALSPCQALHIPLVFFVHGSSIEYTINKDARYLVYARRAIEQATAIVCGNVEVRARLFRLFPDLTELVLQKTAIIGVGVDTQAFKPVPKPLRAQHLTGLFADGVFTNTNGKSPKHKTELYEYLAKGDYAQILKQFHRYDETVLDLNVREKLVLLNLEQPIILFVGAFTAGKGVQTLLCAMPEVLAKYPHAQLLIVGSGAYREVLESLVYALANADLKLFDYLMQRGFDLDSSDETGPWDDILHYYKLPENLQTLFGIGSRLENKITFIGRCNHKQLAYIFPIADIAVFPSIKPEAYGLVLMEALASGVFPLVSYFSGFKEGIDDLSKYLDPALTEHMKIEIDPENRVASVAKNIVRLIEKTQQHDYHETLAEIAQRHYDWHVRAKELEKLFNNILVQAGFIQSPLPINKHLDEMSTK